MENKIILTDGQSLPVMMLAQDRAQLLQKVGLVENSLQALATAYAGAAGQDGQWDFQQVEGGKLALVRIDPQPASAAPPDVTE